MNDWNHQTRGVAETIEAIDAGETAICLTSPTGGGKTRMAERLIEAMAARQMRAGMFTDRKMLFDQLRLDLETNFDVGLIAAGHKPAFLRDVQLAMMQTVAARSAKDGKWLPDLGLGMIDEAHRHCAERARTIIQHYEDKGTPIVGVTATPLDLEGIYKRLVIAGTNSELRDCGALVWCDMYSPDEPDTKELEKRPRSKTGEFTEGDVRKTIWSPNIIGRVIENHRRLNPELKPAILFAPGVKESRWFAEAYEKAGIKAAHIDGDDVYVDGQYHPTSTALREEVLQRSQDGDIKVICNRFVMREGINAPWLYHGILATIFGSLTSYLQSVGRLLRSYPGLARVILQDHGGNYWRHDDPNADQVWTLGDTARRRAVERQEAYREKTEPEPIRCPECGKIRLSGPECGCGFKHRRSVRAVVQLDGSLKAVTGDVYHKIARSERADTQSIWERCFWAIRKSGGTFRQAEGYFVSQAHYYPKRTQNFMPANAGDWLAKIADVPFSDLIGYDAAKDRVKSVSDGKKKPATKAQERMERTLF